MKNNRYKLVISNLLPELENKVNELVTLGYEPIGSPILIDVENDKIMPPTIKNMAQAMYKKPEIVITNRCDNDKD